MEVTTRPASGHVELLITGRIDAMWADHLNAEIENTIRAGGHRILLNFFGVDYISSMGLRVLLVQYKLLKSINGSLAITHPNEMCRNIFSIVGLMELIADYDDASAEISSAIPKLRIGSVDYEIYPQAVNRELKVQLAGKPDRLATSGFEQDDCRRIAFPSGTFGVGLGAFGEGYTDCVDRFGEFLAAGGCAISLPTDEAHALSDYVIEEGQLIPEVETLYAISGEGDFSTMVRFDAAPDGLGKIALSELVDGIFEISGVKTFGMVVLAETAGIVGATLLKSPAGKPLDSLLPGVRDWLSFTTERSSEKSLCLIVGVVSRSVDGRAQAFLRPMQTDSEISAHVHAAVFPYRPVQRGELPLRETVANLLASSSPGAVFHLMTDTRPFEGVGETDLIRGACWFGPLSSMEMEKL